MTKPKSRVQAVRTALNPLNRDSTGRAATGKIAYSPTREYNKTIPGSFQTYAEASQRRINLAPRGKTPAQKKKQQVIGTALTFSNNPMARDASTGKAATGRVGAQRMPSGFLKNAGPYRVNGKPSSRFMVTRDAKSPQQKPSSPRKKR